jgi:hypothetical protein
MLKERIMAGNQVESQLLDRINTLALELQRQRHSPVLDKREHALLTMKLQRDLAACWAQMRQERAGPVFSEAGSTQPLHGQNVPHGRNWRG